MISFARKSTYTTARWISLFALTVLMSGLLQVLNLRPVFADAYPWPNAPCAWSPHNTTGACSGYDWGLTTCPSGDGYCTSGNQINGYYQLDNWGYGFRNCTSYAAWKINQQFSVSNITGWGNASTWDTGVAPPGGNYQPYTVHTASGYTPQVGDLAQWGTEVASGFGHVSYVYAVNNGIASLDDYNQDTTGDFSSSNTTASGSEGTPDHYIHIGTAATPTNSRPASITRSSGTMDVFYRDTSAKLINIGWNSSTGWSSPTAKASSGVSSNPTAVARDSNNMDVFYRDTSNNIQDIGWNSSTGWGSPVGRVTDGSAVGDPVVVSRSSGTMDVFYHAIVSGNYKLMGVSWDSNGWSSPYPIVSSGVSGSPTAVGRDSTDMDIFYRDSSNNLADVGWTYSGGFTSPATRVSGTATGDFSVVARDSGNMDVFYPTTSGGMGDAGWNWQTGWSVQTWSGGNLIATSGDSFVGTPNAIKGDSGDMDVFYQDSGANLVDKGWNSTTGWAAPYNRASNIEDNPAGVARSSGNMDEFYRDSSSNLIDDGWDVNVGWSQSAPGAGGV